MTTQGNALLGKTHCSVPSLPYTDTQEAGETKCKQLVKQVKGIQKVLRVFSTFL